MKGRLFCWKMPTLNLTKTPQLLSLAPGSTWTFQNTGPQRIAISQLTDGLVGSSITGWIGAGGSRDVLVPSNGELYAFSEFNGVASIDYVERPIPGGTALGQFAYRGEKAIFASQSHLSNVVANGHSVQTVPRIVLREKVHPAAGRWKALAVMYVNWRRNTSIGASESDAGLADVDIVGAGIELVAQPITGTRNQSHPNTGGPTAVITFGGAPGIRMQVGDSIVSDWILPSQFGLEFFEFTTRELSPWIRTFFASPDRTSGIFLPSTMGPTTTTYYQQDYYATPADDAAGNALVAPTGNTSRISGLTFVNGQVVPAPLCLIGIPADGQKAVLVLGTSRFDSGANFSDRAQTYFGAVGAGNGGTFTDGPADSSYLDLPGPAAKWLQDPEVSAPFVMLATGGGSLAVNWSTYTGGRPTTGISYENPGGGRNDGHRFLMQFADVLVNEHGVNDSYVGVGGYTDADFKAQHGAIATEFKRINPVGKYIACHGPCSGYSTTAVALNPASQTNANGTYVANYLARLNELVTEGKVDYIWDWKSTDAVGSGLNAFSWGVSSPLVIWSGTTTTGSTTSSINLNGAVNMLKRRHYNQCILRIAGEDRFINSNTGNTISVSAPLSSAPGAGVTVEILGNYSHDGLHPSGWGEVRLAQDAKAKLNRFIRPINRPNTA